MAHKRLEEKFETVDAEIAKVRVGIQKLPIMEETMKSIAKSIERLNIQANLQQRTSEEVMKLLANVLTDVSQLRIMRFSSEEGSRGMVKEKDVVGAGTTKLNEVVRMGIDDSEMNETNSRTWKCWYSMERFSTHGYFVQNAIFISISCRKRRR